MSEQVNKKIINWRKIRSFARNVIDELGVKINVNEMLGNASIAKQQMVAIARATSFGSRLIIMDEPTSSLSIKEIEALYEIIKELKTKGISVLFVSHKLEEVFKISDRVTVLRDGKFIGCEDIKKLKQKKLIEMMVGREIEVLPQQRDLKRKKILLEVKDLSKKNFFSDISFTLHEGEILGITGMVGSGRSEVAKSIYGILPADYGEILLNREGKININSPVKALKLGIAYLPEDRRSQGIGRVENWRAT